MKLFHIVLSLTFVLMFGHAVAQDNATVLSIKECIEYASEHNSQIKISRYEQDIVHQQTNEIRGRALPQANINGSFENRLKLPQLVLPGGGLPGAPGGDGIRIPMGFRYNSNLMGEVSQMIYDPSLGVALKGAREAGSLSVQKTQQVSEQTAYNIASAYYQVIVLKHQLALLQTSLTNTRQSLANTELLYKEGLAKRVDVSRLKVNSSNLESQIRQSELGLNESLNYLRFQMGMPLEQPLILSDTILTLTEEINIEDAGSLNYANRLDFKILQTNMRIQELNRQGTIKGYFPTLRAFANYGYQAQGPEFGFFATPNNGWVDFTTSAIGLRLNIPVFDGLQRNARVQQSGIQIKQLKENIKLSKQSIDLEVSNARTQYNNTLQRIESEMKNVQLAEEVYQITQLEFREGVSTSTDLVGAETSLRQAQNTYAQTLLDLYTARLNMELAKGNLLNYLNSK